MDTDIYHLLNHIFHAHNIQDEARQDRSLKLNLASLHGWLKLSHSGFHLLPPRVHISKTLWLHEHPWDSNTGTAIWEVGTPSRALVSTCKSHHLHFTSTLPWPFGSTTGTDAVQVVVLAIASGFSRIPLSYLRSGQLFHSILSHLRETHWNCSHWTSDKASFLLERKSMCVYIYKYRYSGDVCLCWQKIKN